MRTLGIILIVGLGILSIILLFALILHYPITEQQEVYVYTNARPLDNSDLEQLIRIDSLLNTIKDSILYEKLSA